MNSKLDGMTQKDRLHEFFCQYIRPYSRQIYDADGLISTATMKEAVHLLLDNKVFDNKYALKREALKDFEVIIPDELF